LRIGRLLALCILDVEVDRRSSKLTIYQAKHGGYGEIPHALDVRKALSSYLETHTNADYPDTTLWISSFGPLNHRSLVMRILSKYASPIN
jgi:hypothetical protein